MPIRDLEAQVEISRIERAKQRLRDVWAYRRVDHIPVFIRISDRLGYTRREIIQSDELQYQINKNNIQRSLRTLPDDYIPYARVWFGYMTLATMFGLPVYWSEDPDQSPSVEFPLINDLQQIEDLPRPDPRRAGLMTDNLRLQRIFARRFPEWVHLSGFDLGGPLNSCRDLMDTQLLYTAMVEHPETLERLLSLITEVQMECYQATIEASGGLQRLTCIDMAQVWTPGDHKGFISDDVSATISPAMFERFSKPFNNRILSRWPGGLLHNCGPHPAVEHYLEHTPPLNGINCSFRYTRDDLPSLRKAFAGRGLVQIMFDNGETAQEMLQGFRHLMDSLAPDVVALPMPIVNDDWSDGEIRDLYCAMREIGQEYAAKMRWREGDQDL